MAKLDKEFPVAYHVAGHPSGAADKRSSCVTVLPLRRTCRLVAFPGDDRPRLIDALFDPLSAASRAPIPTRSSFFQNMLLLLTALPLSSASC